MSREEKASFQRKISRLNLSKERNIEKTNVITVDVKSRRKIRLKNVSIDSKKFFQGLSTLPNEISRPVFLLFSVQRLLREMVGEKFAADTRRSMFIVRTMFQSVSLR